MRGPIALLSCAFALAACEHIGTGTAADGGSPANEPENTADAGIVGGGCGREPATGVELCIATSACPEVVVDTQALPGCGFRIRGGAVDLVCMCGTWICPMGVFTSCEEAAQLLTSQTQQGICTQIAEGRCSEAPTTDDAATPNPENPACDRDCLRECGGGAGCAAVCNCD